MKPLLTGIILLLPFLVNSQGRDSLCFHNTFLRLHQEVLKKGALNLDTMIWYGNKAQAEGNKINNRTELIRVYLNLGQGFIAKTEVDSAKHYYKLAIDLAKEINNLNLLATAYSGFGWSLVYDNSEYKGAIENLLKATAIAEDSRDTVAYISVATKLVKVYYQASQFLKAYELCTYLQDICEFRRDTNAQINNYHMFSSIYGRMNLYEKQMEMVYKALALTRNKQDPSYKYTINLTASNGYLFKKQYDSVLYYSRLNLPLCQQLNFMPNCYGNMAKAFLETYQLDSARYYYGLIMDYHQSHHTYIDTYLYLDLGNLEFRSGNLDKALDYYKKAEADISKPSLSTQTEIFKALYEYYDSFGLPERTLHYLRKYKTWSDSLSDQQFGWAVMQYESSLMKEENTKLLKEKDFQALLADKLKLEANLLYSAIALLISISAVFFIWLWKKRTARQKQLLIQERLRISRELHDEVGGTLSGIAMYSHVAAAQLHNSETRAVEQSLSYMQKSAGEMVSKLSDIVWLINPEQDTVLEMFGRLGEYGRQMTRARDMQIKVDVPSDLVSKHIPLKDRRNIYLFCKEAINNAVKYSNGKTMVLQVKSMGQQLIFSVTDDGNGFDESIIRHGNGLINMQRRAEDIGAVFHMDTRINLGTRLELQYKIIQ